MVVVGKVLRLQAMPSPSGSSGDAVPRLTRGVASSLPRHGIKLQAALITEHDKVPERRRRHVFLTLFCCIASRLPVEEFSMAHKYFHILTIYELVP